MAAIGAIPPDALNGFTVLGELGLDGSIAPVAGVLPAAIGANSRDEGLICPARCGAEAAWGEPRYPDRRRPFVDPDRESFQGHAGAVAPLTEGARARGRYARPARHQGTRKRQARARDCRGRRTSFSDDRLARRRQVDAGSASSLNPVAAY